jgi:anti-sigma factor RsiW
MDCNEVRALVPAYVDREVGISDARSIEAHLETCEACRTDRNVQSTLKGSVAMHATYLRAPSALAERIAAAIGADAESQGADALVQPTQGRSPARPDNPRQAPTWQRWFRAHGLAAGLVMASAAAVFLATAAYVALPRPGAALGAELVASHVRSLVSNRGIDVASSDQHTVKPWFDGKIDYAPSVHDLTSDGFPLVGGRVDYVDHRRVATLVYRRRLHVIDLYVWPEANAGADSTRATRDGYQLLGWHHQGMRYWAVSDIEPSELDKLRATLEKQP